MVPDSFSPEDGRTPAAAAPPHAAAPECAAAAAGAAAGEPSEDAAAGAAAGPPPAALDEADAAPASEDEDDGDAEFVDATELSDDEDERDHHGLTPEERAILDDQALWDAKAKLCARPAQLWGLPARARGGALCLNRLGPPPGALHKRLAPTARGSGRLPLVDVSPEQRSVFCVASAARRISASRCWCECHEDRRARMKVLGVKAWVAWPQAARGGPAAVSSTPSAIRARASSLRWCRPRSRSGRTRSSSS